MRFQRTGVHVVVILGIACLGAFWSPIARAQVKLEYKFPEGKRLTYKTNSRVRQVLTFMNNMEKASAVRETKVWTRSVGKRRADSTLPIEDKVESLRDEYTLTGGIRLTLDSSDPKSKIDIPELKFVGDEFKLRSTLAYTVLLDAQAKVKAIEGTERLKVEIAKLDSPVAVEEFYNQVDSDRLKARFEQVMHNLPDVPARTGEPWERSELLEINGAAFMVRKKYEYRGMEKRAGKPLEKVTYKVLEVKYEQGPKTKLPVSIVKSDLKIESSDGTLLFDREEGHLATASEKIRIKGNMTFSAGGVEQSGAFDLNLDISTELQSSPK